MLTGARQMSSTLAEYLKTTDVEATLIHCDTTTPTVERAAAALGVPASAIVKSIVLEYKQARPGVCLVIVSGDRRVSRVKVAAALAVDRLRLASAEVVQEATGYWPGGVPPIGHRQPLEVVIDRRVFDHDVVYGGGGDEWHMVRIRPQVIQRLTAARVADVVEDPAADDARGRTRDRAQHRV